jgi:hypothetical protein
MDVAFVVDVTGSMQPPIDNVKAAIPQLLTQVESASAGDYRAELVVFRDDVNVMVPFASSNRSAIETAVAGLFATGGNNEPEASDEALRTVIDALGPRPGQTGTALPFRSSVVKIIVLITDAHPGGFDDTFTPGVDDVNANQRALDAAAQGIKISAVYVPSGGFPIADIVAIMQNYATRTSGIFLQTQPNGVGTADAIREVISACGGGPPPDGGTPDGGGGGGNGDVHFRTFAGQSYDYQREACLTLARSTTPGSNVGLQIDAHPWPHNPDTTVARRAAFAFPDSSNPYAVVLDIAAPHLSVQGQGDTLVEVRGNLDGEGWVGFKQPGTRVLQGEISVQRKSFSGVIGYEYLASYHGGISSGSQIHALVFPAQGYINVTMIPVPALSVEGMSGSSRTGSSLNFGDGVGSTTVQTLRTDVATLNAFAESWSTAVTGSLFSSGCPTRPGVQDAIIALTLAQQSAVAETCRANGITEEAGTRWEECLFDAHVGGPVMAYTQGVSYARQQAIDVGTVEAIYPAPAGAPDAGTTRTGSRSSGP